MQVIKRDGTKEDVKIEKILHAVVVLTHFFHTFSTHSVGYRWVYQGLFQVKICK